ncbi:MAG: polysaccharide biosynthesis C-terminal domain-containing protein, partial [Candidatus Omnitrophica bacterium]|nr:polysaccharide biosynthesis C-terminal domain-containing protein [Candidatus Omnitrophota bacterium]
MLRYSLHLATIEVIRVSFSVFNTILIAHYFGASAATDAFFLIYIFVVRIGDRVRKAINVTFVPVLVDYKILQGTSARKGMTNAFATRAILVACPIMIVFAVFSPYWLKIAAFGFGTEAYEIAVRLTWLLAPMGILFVTFAVCESIFIAEKKVLISSLTTIIASAGPIAGILILSRYIGIYSAAVGITLGGVLTLFALYLFLVKSGNKFQLTLEVGEKGAVKVSRNLAPALTYNVILQIIIAIDRIFATQIGEGYTSALSYAFSVSFLIPALLTPSVLIPVLPVLSENLTKKDYAAFTTLFVRSMKLIAFVAIPVCVMMLLMGETIIRLFLQRGEFDLAALKNTVTAFHYYMLGMPAYALWGFVAAIFVVLGKMKHLIYGSLLLLFISIAINAILMKWLGFTGLPIATSIVFFLQLFYFLAALRRDERFLGFKGVIPHFFMVCSATACMVLFYLVLMKYSRFWPSGEVGQLMQFVNMGLLILLGTTIYISVAKWLRIEEASSIFNTFGKIVL